MKVTRNDISIVLGYPSLEAFEADWVNLTVEEQAEMWELAAADVPF